MNRRSTTIFIHLFVAVQLLVPALYYLTTEDKYDERYAWRMFSPTRSAVCGSGEELRSPPEFLVGGEPILLYGKFHEAWVTLAKRGRKSVIEAMAERLCADHPNQAVRVRYSCRDVDNTVTPVSTGSVDFCETGKL
jgi:hypothetical protein